jgi:hypothetical protein
MTAQLKSVADMRAFVINLCSSTTPMALTPPQAPELKRFEFFMSRRREDGRERFRLHMGFFSSLTEAEEWLAVVREIYPGAWAGEAPGKHLPQSQKSGAAPAAIAAAQPLAPVPVPPPVAVPVAKPAVSISIPPSTPPVVAPRKPLAPQSNVREVLKSLDETAETRLMPKPLPPTLPAAHVSKPSSLSDTAVLAILERSDVQNGVGGIEMLRPDDTGTRRALKEAVSSGQEVSFSVQLHWSVQPIDLTTVPPLAIFSAYTLYTVEGSRDGRKWYGLRLGFFTDAVSAKQVALYVRSEFATVAVIPVSAKEKDRATQGSGKPSTSTAERPKKPVESTADTFKLIDDAQQKDKKISKPAVKSPRAAVVAKPLSRMSRKKLTSSSNKVRATEKRSPKSLEETLEILGASQLEIDSGRGELLNDSGVRHLRVEARKSNSPFAKLLDRLTDRVRKN